MPIFFKQKCQSVSRGGKSPQNVDMYFSLEDYIIVFQEKHYNTCTKVKAIKYIVGTADSNFPDS